MSPRVKTAFSGSAPMPLELFKRFEEATGVTIVEGYGLTEATCLVSVNPWTGRRRWARSGCRSPIPTCGSCGSRTASRRNAASTRWARSASPIPASMPATPIPRRTRTASFFTTAPILRTGDLGRIDPDGYLWITGRAKDLIIRGGHNIDPAEIEEALLGHPAVAFAGAIGQPDAHSGELPCAYVELVGGATATDEELMEHARLHVHERAAQPKHIEILDELPKTAVGKVFKPDLRKLAITRVYDAALEKAGCPARVAAWCDDKKRGLVAQLDATARTRRSRQGAGRLHPALGVAAPGLRGAARCCRRQEALGQLLCCSSRGGVDCGPVHSVTGGAPPTKRLSFW